MTALTFTVGTDVEHGTAVTADLARLPHLLIAGTTGSGKTTLVHSILVELLERHGPDSLRLILIDPKRVELRAYRDLPHLLGAPIVSLTEAVVALEWAQSEMERRYGLLERADVRDLDAYNATARERLPRIVIVIDELANLMLTDRRAIEPALVQLAAMGRAAGIHVIMATQHPSADVLTGLLRANVPSRAAFATATSTDSRVLLGTRGAEQLPGKGAMLFRLGQSTVRLQGRFVDDATIDTAVARWATAVQPRRWAPAPGEPAEQPSIEAAPAVRTQSARPSLLRLVRPVALPIGVFAVAMVLGATIGVGLLAAGLTAFLVR
jgi:DNA segregation ATPase FtsK/SpoIIIE, S-DNA-T family